MIYDPLTPLSRPRRVERLPSEGVLSAAKALLSLVPEGSPSPPSCAPPRSNPPPFLALPSLSEHSENEACSDDSVSSNATPALCPSSYSSMSLCNSPPATSHDPSSRSTPDSSQHFFTGCCSLALPQDEESLSPLHCFMRRYCVEAFTAGPDEISTPKYGRNPSTGRRIRLGQVGIRCLHCNNKPGRQERAVCFPSSLKNIYHSIETWQRRHSLVCRHIPAWIKVEMTRLMETSRSGAGGRRQYWEESAQRIGIVDTPMGLRFIREPGTTLLDNQEAVKTRDGHPLVAMTHSLQNSTPGRPVVHEQDRDLVTGYLFLLLEQMETCQFTEQDRTGGRSKVKDCPVGFPGLQCKHCAGKAGFGRYFPTTLRALTSANSDRNIYNHILKCRRCPTQIRDELTRLQQTHNRKNNKNKRGWRKQFFQQVWHNLHGTDAVEVVSLPRTDTPTFTQEAIAI